MKKADLVTTVLGGFIAAGTAAQPVLTSVAGGSLHANDWLQLATAIVFALFGWATNKQGLDIKSAANPTP